MNDNGIDVERNGSIVPAMAPWADILYASDCEWWRKNAQSALKFEGIKVTCMESLEFKAVYSLKQTGSVGFDPDPRHIRTGGNSGYASLHLAIQAGAKRILLLGYNMSGKNGAHWFGKHTMGLRNTDALTFPRWIERFPALKNQGSEIINCTKDSALTCFPYMELSEAIQK